MDTGAAPAHRRMMPQADMSMDEVFHYLGRTLLTTLQQLLLLAGPAFVFGFAMLTRFSMALCGVMLFSLLLNLMALCALAIFTYLLRPAKLGFRK
jgi:hypothetical protein